MKVSEAVESRRSIRAFLDKPIENSTIEALLEKSARAASGGNLQPWRISVINNESMDKFLEFQKKQKTIRKKHLKPIPASLLTLTQSLKNMTEKSSHPKRERIEVVGFLCLSFCF